MTDRTQKNFALIGAALQEQIADYNADFEGENKVLRAKNRLL